MSIIKLKKGKNTEEIFEIKEENNKEEIIEKTVEMSGVLFENKSKANEHSKHYVFNNKTAKTIISSVPTNYFDENEKEWKKIDNTLIEDNEKFVTKKGKYKKEFLKANKGQGSKISKENLDISWQYLGKSSSSNSNLLINNKSQKGRNKTECDVLYENIESGTNLEYRLIGNDLKENIIVKEKNSEYKYQFLLKTNGLKLRLKDDNESIELYKEENGEQKVEFTIPSPYMFDATGDMSDDVYYEIESEDDNNHIFTIIASSDWINNENRVLPITIDPQIITNHENIISSKIYSRTVTSTSSGTVYGNWTACGQNMITAYGVNGTIYKSAITINKESLSLLKEKVSKVTLKFNKDPLSTPNSLFYFDGTLSSSDGDVLEYDVTNKFISSPGNFIIEITPYSNDRIILGMDVILTIEYLIDENVKEIQKIFNLNSKTTGKLNVFTGELVTSICDVEPKDSVMGCGIYHIYKKSNENYLLGSNYRLNLHESLISYGNDKFIYTDSLGNKYGFREYCYYLDSNNNKVYIDSKLNIVSEPDGSLSYTVGSNKYKVYLEYKSKTGLKAMTTLKEFKNIDYFEQRGDELKQLEEQVESYKNYLGQYVAFVMDTYEEKSDYKLKDYIDNPNKFEEFIDYIREKGEIVVITEDYAQSIKSLEFQLKSLNSQSDSLNIQIKSLENIKELTEDGNYKSYTIQNDLNKKNLDLLKNQKNDIDTQISYIKIQKTNLNDTIEIKTIKELKKYYKEYYNLTEKLRQKRRQEPISYITDGKIIKGFNEIGNLVVIYDMYDNYAVINYEEYYESTLTKERISAIYDNNGKQVTFTYNKDNLLSYITDIRGRRTEFTYTSINLSHISYDSQDNITLTYYNKDISGITESKEGIKTTLSYSNNRLLSLKNYSIVDDISINSSVKANKLVSTTSISYNPTSSLPLTYVTIQNNNVKERYYFDDNGNNIEYRLEENGLVTKAEKYQYNPYWILDDKQTDPKEVLTTARKESLNKLSLNNYNFEVGDTVTTVIDQFNKPISKVSSSILCSKWIDSNGITQDNYQTIETLYTYDDNQKLIKEKTTINYTNPSKSVTNVINYNYNLSGDVIRKESYIEGEELITGKLIEEIIYNEKGNVTKKFTYNSLDTSNKFYEEVEYDDKGKVKSRIDALGINKTGYVYLDGSDVVINELLPNGSKYAYGYDYDDSINSITLSSEEGEESKVQRIYKNKTIVELNSINNNIKYTYDYKRRVISIDLDDTPNYVSFTYDEIQDNNVITNTKVTSTYKNGDIFINEYDASGNLLSNTIQGIKQVTNTYNSKNHLTTTVDNLTSKTHTYTRDELDRLTSYTISNGYNENYQYNDYGSLAKKVLSGDVSHTYQYIYSNDSKHNLESIKFNSILETKFLLDKSSRYVGKEVYNGTNKISEEKLTYYKLGDHATNLPSKISYNGNKDSVRYVYDNMSNISKVYINEELAIKYHYNTLNQLVREDNKQLNKTYMYAYDNNGNILKKREFNFTLVNSSLIEELESNDKVYVYEKDRLVSFNNQTIVYNATGNPIIYLGKTLVWKNNRQLDSYNGIKFNYDGLGRRISKGDINFVYDLEGRLIKQGDNIEFIYDNNGVSGIKYNDSLYLYRKNSQQDIIALLDNEGNVVVRYLYDAWGNHEVVDSNGVVINSNTHIGNINPFRYRNYYYDVETQLYWVSSRYYSPELCRWISPDSIEYLDPESINGLNLYAYCGNDPVNRFDPSGHAWEWSTFWTGLFMVGTAVSAIALSIATFGAATPLAMTIIAGVTLGAGVLTGINGVATMIEAGTQYNFVRDGVFNGLGWSDSAYDIYAGVTMGIAELGSIILGIYQITPSGKRVMADNEMQRIINNPQRIQRYNTDKFGKLASRSSWDYSPAKNGKGMRAILNDKSIRFNMNGTRFDVAHFYGDPYWVVSSATLGKLKYLYLF